ncbi:cobyric acid synthase [Natronococcus jeotgali]|uniref:Probable cobyric acid synthase n=1 Tax=Natronococcus jeotgali DSM 18795 TaxID=1227498 RepID=L9X070_9EURY|nr:cobyric acid synthase [Natronococcus jeotgali]ELY55149.1 cobyric acid synthase [Natronococcus jeotgali DSM 18795]
MTRTLLVAGTASHIGKSTVVAGLCRYLADRGVSVAPYKAQNMSNNARVAVRPEASDDPDGTSDGNDRWGEIGVSQFVQARAARIAPTTDCNPVLLKPRGDGESQLVVGGRAREHVPAGSYYEEHWREARGAAVDAYRRLAADHEVIVAEGAGSIAEINLRDRDLANLETARFADADVLLLVDIERGGAFASLYGTIELLPDDIRERVVGAAITKFRGDPALLEPGIEEIESRTGVPILGVVPYDDPGLPEEDSVGLPGPGERGVLGADGVPAQRRLTIAVPRLPRLSNATDLEALSTAPGVAVEFVPLERGDGDPHPLADADAVVLPGTKNAVDDLRALRASAVGPALERFSGPVVGLCGGYQLLGERITNAALEGVGDEDVVEGLGLLPVETRFEPDKRLERNAVTVDGSASPLLADADGAVARGYEIHAGRTRALEAVDRPLGETSAARGTVLGTYLHGLFDAAPVREAFLGTVAASAGIDRPDDSSGGDDARPADRAASLVADNVDLEALGAPFDD